MWTLSVCSKNTLYRVMKQQRNQTAVHCKLDTVKMVGKTLNKNISMFNILHWHLVSVYFSTGKDRKDRQNDECAKVSLWFIYRFLTKKVFPFQYRSELFIYLPNIKKTFLCVQEKMDAMVWTEIYIFFNSKWFFDLDGKHFSK